MGLFRGLAGFLGIDKDETEDFKDEEDDNDVRSRSVPAHNLPVKASLFQSKSPSIDPCLALFSSSEPPDGVQNVEDLFGFLGQDPSCALRDALLPAIKGLISDKLFRHPDTDVKVSVLSCIHELLRITAPDTPYENDAMKEIFRQTLIAFEKLSLFTGRCYTKALHIFETVAKVRSFLILLDLGCDELIIQMFQLLLDTIRSNHSDAVFSNMEEIMTLLIEESDEISLELLKPLLTSVKKENQNISPLSWRLGMKVLTSCSAKVKPCLVKAVEQMRVDIEYYTGILGSWTDVPAEKDVMKEAETDDSPAQQRDNHKGTFVDGTSSKTLVCYKQIEPLQIIAEDSIQHEALESVKELRIKASAPAVPRRRGGKPNSMRKLDKGSKDFGVSGGRTYSEAHRKRKNHGTLGSSPKKLSLEKSPKLSKSGSLDQTFARRGRPKKKGNMKNVVVKKEDNFLNDSEMEDKTAAEDSDAEGSLIRSYRKSGGAKEYREELIGSSVKVWWPRDHQFYDGVVESYDPIKKKHKIAYVDGDVEILRMKKERWLLLHDISTEEDQEAILPISSVVSVKSEEESSFKEEHNTKLKNSGLSSKRKDKASSSKRRKHGNDSVAANTAQDILDIKKELDTPGDDDDRHLISEMLRYVRRSSK